MQSFPRSPRHVIYRHRIGPGVPSIRRSPYQKVTVSRQAMGVRTGCHSTASYGADQRRLAANHDTGSTMSAESKSWKLGHFYGCRKASPFVVRPCEPDRVFAPEYQL